jgi:hypothetical protein
MSEPYHESRASTHAKIAIIRGLLRPNAPHIPNVEEFLTATPQGPKKLAIVLSEETKALLIMDRYERRALSRRKFAIRALDLARQQAAKP